MELDLLISAASIITIDPRRPRAHAVGILHGRIIGFDEDVRYLPSRERLNVQDGTVVPGIRDAHVHSTSTGIVARGLDLSKAETTSSALAELSNYCKGRPSEEVVVGFGWQFDANTDDAPTHRDLAVAAGGRVVMLIHRSGHQCVVSTRLFGFIRERLGESPAGFVRRGKDGRPSGILSESAMDTAKEFLGVGRTGDLVSAIDSATSAFLKLGITSFTEAGIGCPGLDHSPVEIAAYQRAREEEVLRVRANLMIYSEQLHSLSAHTHDQEKFGIDLGIRTGFGDPYLRIGAMKIWVDGAGSGRAAAELVDDPGRLTAQIIGAHRAGWQVAAHAMGDVGVELVLNALTQAGPQEEVRRRRHRIEHAAVVRDDQVVRMASLGVIAVIQPAFIEAFGDAIAESSGRDIHDIIRARSLILNGVTVVASSDAPVADPSPLVGMAALSERRTSSGRILGIRERLSSYAALKAYTLDSAFADNLDDLLGSISPGKLADLTVLGSDPTVLSPADVGAVDIEATIIDGRIAYLNQPERRGDASV